MGDRDTDGLQRNDISDNIATSPTIANVTSMGSDHSKTISEVDDQEKKINYDSEKQVVPEEKEGGYGWVIVFAVFLLNFATWGMNSGFAVYFSYYLNNNTFAGASRIDYSVIGGCAFGVGLFFAPIINYIQGIIGIKWTIVLGNCLQFTALMLASWSVNLWQLYLTQGVMQSFGLAFISLPGLTILPQWFKKKRTFAGGLATAGSGCGGIVFNLGMQAVIKSLTVFWALRCQSIIGFGLVWIAILLIKDKHKHTGHIQFTFIDKQVLRTFGFYVMAFFIITCMFGYVVVLYTLVNFTTSLGYSEHQGSIVSAMIQLGSVVGRPLIGMVADRIGPITMLTIVYLISAIFTLAMWIPARNWATMLIYGLIMGSIMGSIYGACAPMVARIVGLKKLNVAFCMLWVCLGASGLASPVIGVGLVTGSSEITSPTQYLHCTIFAGVSFFACSASVLLLRGYVIARDRLSSHIDSDTGGHLDVRVPPMQALKCMFMWPQRRA